MEIMQFVIGLYLGLVAGFMLRGVLNKLEYTIRHSRTFTHGSKTKNH